MKSEIISLETAKKIEELERENKILNNIINKAIEYCNLYTRLSAKELLDILQGVDKE